jgi:hypothetical protein
MKPSSQFRTLISLLVIVAVIAGLVCTPLAVHCGMDFGCPADILSLSPTLNQSHRLLLSHRAANWFSAPYFPASPDRAPPSIQTASAV